MTAVVKKRSPRQINFVDHFRETQIIVVSLGTGGKCRQWIPKWPAGGLVFMDSPGAQLSCIVANGDGGSRSCHKNIAAI